MSEWYHEKGINKTGIWITVTLAVATTLGSAIAAIEATQLWKNKPKIKEDYTFSAGSPSRH